MADEEKTPDTTETPQVAVERVARPDKDELDKRVGVIEQEIEDLKARQEALHEFRKAATTGGPKTGPLADARAAFKVLSDKARVIREERKGYFDAMAAAKAAREKMNASMDAMKDSMGPMKSLDDLNKKIKKLDMKHQSTSMTLKEEKTLITELEALKMMRKEALKFEAAKTKAAGGASAAQGKEEVSARLDATKEELAKLNEQMDASKAAIEKLQSKDKTASARAQIPAVLRELDRLSSEIDGCYTRIRALRNDFREDNNKWYEYSKVLREQKQKKYEAEASERKAAWETRQAELEAEEALKVPWEEEMVLCDFIIKYLSNLIAEKAEAESSAAASIGEFDGMQLAKRDESDFFDLGGGKSAKKKGKGKGKKASLLKHSIETIEDFGLLGIMPPKTQDAIAASIEEVKAAKAAFEVRPREPKAAKAKKSDGDAEAPKAKKSQKKYEHDTSMAAFPKLGQ